MLDAWSQSMASIDVGVAIKCGLRLTYDQYDGLRNLLAYDLVDTHNKPKVEPTSGYFGKHLCVFSRSVTCRLSISSVANGSTNQTLDGFTNERTWTH